MSNINNNTTNLENILDTIDDIAGSPILLWTNPSPTSSFAAQTITVASGYDAYLIEARYGTTSSNAYYNIAYVVNNGTQQFFFAGYTANRVEIKPITPSGNTLTVASGYTTTYCIPTRIWGVKFTL